MSSFKGWFLALACVALSAHSVSATSLYFDFGYGTSQSTNYNNIVVDQPLTPQPIDKSNLIDITGSDTGISVSVSGFFPGGNPNGVGTTPTPPAGDAAATFVATAMVDNMFTHVGEFGGQTTNPKGSVVLSGLNDSTAYDFTFFASRMGVGDNRESMYTVTGSNSAVTYLNASNNDRNITSVGGIYPNAGSITINVEAGPNNNNGATRFAYIGALRVDYTAVPEPTTFGLLALSSLGLVMRRRSA